MVIAVDRWEGLQGLVDNGGTRREHLAEMQRCRVAEWTEQERKLPVVDRNRRVGVELQQHRVTERIQQEHRFVRVLHKLLQAARILVGRIEAVVAVADIDSLLDIAHTELLVAAQIRRNRNQGTEDGLLLAEDLLDHSHMPDRDLGAVQAVVEVDRLVKAAELLEAVGIPCS